MLDNGKEEPAYNATSLLFVDTIRILPPSPRFEQHKILIHQSCFQCMIDNQDIPL